MLAVVTNPPDAGDRLETGTAGTGGNFLTPAFGARFRLCRFPAIFHILAFFFCFVSHLKPPVKPKSN